MAKKKKQPWDKYKGGKKIKQTKHKIVELVREKGKRPCKAARQVGVVQSTFRTWKERDGTFETELGKAEEEYLEYLYDIATTDLPDSPSRAFRMLQIRDKETWGEVQQIETKQEVTHGISDKDRELVGELGRLSGSLRKK